MLDDVERSLISIKHRLQHHPTFPLFLSVNKNVAFVWPLCSTLLNARMPAKLTLWVLFPFTVLYLLRALPRGCYDTVWRIRKIFNHSPKKAPAISPQIEKERAKQLLKTRELGNQEDGVTPR